MIATSKGSPDGINVNEYKNGEVYDLPESLYKVFVKGLNVAVDINSDTKIMEEKKLGNAPENKDASKFIKSNKEKEKGKIPFFGKK